MKQITRLLAVFVALLPQLAQAQVTISLNVDSNPNPRISDWVNRAEIAMFTVMNTDPTQLGQEYKIAARMLLNGKAVMETRLNSMPVLQLSLGPQVYFANDIVPYEAIAFFDNFEEKIVKTGYLPAGIYSFCVKAVDLQGRVISRPEEVCRPMRVTTYSTPELLYPIGDMGFSVQALSILRFTWSPITPAPPPDMGVKYVVMVAEVQPSQSPSQAFFVNYPLIEQEVMVGTQLMWPLDLDPPTRTTQYVWAVKALRLDDTPYQPDNRGFSQIGTFEIVVPEVADDPRNEDFGDDMRMGQRRRGGNTDTPDEDLEPGTMSASDTLRAGRNGEFEVMVTRLVENGNTYSGEGTVYIDWLLARVEVQFNDIMVNSDKKLIKGSILAKTYESAPQYPKDWLNEAVSNLPFPNSAVQGVANWIESESGVKIPLNNPEEQPNPIRMPLGLVLSTGDEMTLTEMAFRPDRSEFNIVVAKALPPSLSDQRVGFRARGLEFHPMDINIVPTKIELVDDIRIANVNNAITLVLKKPGNNNQGCYIALGSGGFQEFGLELQTEFTRNWLIPSPDTDPNRKAAASFATKGTSWDDLILTGNMERATIVGSGGMTLLAGSISYDLSDVMNPSGMVFPTNYEGEKSSLFTGFYMKRIEVELPNAWTTQASGKPKIAVQDMIIDNMGLTFKAMALNVIQYPNANVADMSASVDTIRVDVVASSLKSSVVAGRVTLPVTQSNSVQNALRYSALLNVQQGAGRSNSYQLTISPTGPIPVQMLQGEFSLARTSNIVASVDDSRKTFDMNLHGTFGWKGVTLGPVKNVNMGLAFQGLKLTYNSAASTPMTFNAGTWSFASPQKFLANFPVSIKNIGYTQLQTQSGQLLRGKMKFDVIFNLSEVVGGSTSLGVDMAIQNNVNRQKFHPQFIGASIDSISVNANLAAANIRGKVGFRNEHPTFGNGFIGNLEADFKSMSLKIRALAEFGNTAYQNNNVLYRYWRVEANVTLPPPGTPFLPGLAIRGFGGGAYYNMIATASGRTYQFTPKKSSFGMSIAAPIATTPKEDGFNADLKLLGQFSSSNGLTLIAFNGDFWAAANMTTASRNNAIVKGTVNARYDIPRKHFNFNANVNVNRPPVTTPRPVNLTMDVNGLTGQWYFKMGEPSNLNNVNVFSIPSYQYLMMGNSIPYTGAFTTQFSNAYHGVTGSRPSGSADHRVSSSASTGSGFGMGVGFKFDKAARVKVFDVSAVKVFVGYTLAAGAELHLALMQYSGGCSSFNPVGMNGWRANGGLGFYGSASARAYYETWIKDGSVSLASFKGGAWVQGEFPNPYYAAGNISGSVRIAGIVNIRPNISFTAGTKCTNSPSTPTANVAQGDAAADQQQLLVQYVKSSLNTNYPTNEPISVKFGLVPNEVFNVSQQQRNGTIINRTFKLVYTHTLQIKNTNNSSFTNVTVRTSQNSMGEMEFTISGGVPPSNQPAAAPAGTVNYPVASTPPNYGQLPPPPPPTVNNMLPNRDYKFTVTATLKELVGGSWVDARKANGSVVTQTVTKDFRTGTTQSSLSMALPKTLGDY